MLESKSRHSIDQWCVPCSGLDAPIHMGASVMCVPVSEQDTQKLDLGQFYRLELSPGNPAFYVFPVAY